MAVVLVWHSDLLQCPLILYQGLSPVPCAALEPVPCPPPWGHWVQTDLGSGLWVFPEL